MVTRAVMPDSLIGDRGAPGTMARMELHLPPEPADDDKAAWRRELRAARRALVDEQGSDGRARQGEELTTGLLRWLQPYAAGLGRPDLSGWSVTAYTAMPSEPPTEHLLATLAELGVAVWLPVTLSAGRMGWRLAGDPAGEGARTDPLQPDAEAVCQGPEVLDQVDVALIPGLAVSHRGCRLGQGGGYYDRVLPVLRQHPSPAPVITVLHDHEWLPQVPGQPHDALVDAVLSTTGVQWVEQLTPRG